MPELCSVGCVQSDQNRKKTGESVFLGCRNVLFLLFFQYTNLFICMVTKTRISEAESIEIDTTYIVFYFDNHSRYINIDTICINVNKIKSSLVFANSFTVMYKSVCLCFLCV